MNLDLEARFRGFSFIFGVSAYVIFGALKSRVTVTLSREACAIVDWAVVEDPDK